MSAPDDHFAPGPHCRVKVSFGWRVGGAGRYPAVRAGIIFAASVHIVAVIVISAPYNHFAAGPHRRVKLSGSGRVGGAGRCPTGAPARRIPPSEMFGRV